MITLYVIVLLLLGMIIDAGSIMLITVPVMLPMVLVRPLMTPPSRPPEPDVMGGVGSADAVPEPNSG